MPTPIGSPYAVHVMTGVKMFNKVLELFSSKAQRQSEVQADTLPGWIEKGNRFLDAGDLVNAEKAYRQAVQLSPENESANTALAFLLLEQEKFDEAEQVALIALKANTQSYDACYIAGLATRGQGKSVEAARFLGRAVDLKPDFLDAIRDLAIAQFKLGKFDSARDMLEAAIGKWPDFVDFHFCLGNALQGLGDHAAAVDRYMALLKMAPGYAQCHNNLGISLRHVGDYDEAIHHLRLALSSGAEQRDVLLNNYGLALSAKGDIFGALDQFTRAAVANPANPWSYNNLGILFQGQNRLSEAVANYRKALAISPDYPQALNNLAGALQELSRLDEAVDTYRQALELDKGNALIQGNVLFCLNYHPDMPAEEIFAEYRRWGERQTQLVNGAYLKHQNRRDPGKRLRIGYLSADFRKHSARYFIEPLLAAHDKSQVEVYVYSEVVQEDKHTERFKGYADRWLRTTGMNDDLLAERVRDDEVDILVDLAGHTSGNRLRALAKKAAPIQVSWLGFGYTTGLNEMDYFFGDETFTPKGCDHLFVEKVVRLPRFLAYRPGEGMGEPGQPELRQGGQPFAFCTLTRAIRVNDRVVEAWSKILLAVSGARLWINSENFTQGGAQETLMERFAKWGVTADRIVFGYTSPPWDMLRAADLCLDCFPHNSGTTLIESLYMGLPYVSLAGRPSVGRLGSSLLQGAGLAELIAHSEEEYVAKNVALATDPERLARLRNGLRERVQASDLMDEAAFARSVETAYRVMWRRYCAGEAPTAIEAEDLAAETRRAQ